MLMDVLKLPAHRHLKQYGKSWRCLSDRFLSPLIKIPGWDGKLLISKVFYCFLAFALFLKFAVGTTFLVGLETFIQQGFQAFLNSRMGLTHFTYQPR
ncbi:hypothetical protein NIES2100_35280 [Calothrix sp. NIES-2100]|nr:hypothetical protein NIES2100_35280 [Calothrix sp. NIES-2100]